MTKYKNYKWENELLELVNLGMDEELAIMNVVVKYHKYEIKIHRRQNFYYYNGNYRMYLFNECWFSND